MSACFEFSKQTMSDSNLELFYRDKSVEIKNVCSVQSEETEERKKRGFFSSLFTVFRY